MAKGSTRLYTNNNRTKCLCLCFIVSGTFIYCPTNNPEIYQSLVIPKRSTNQFYGMELICLKIQTTRSFELLDSRNVMLHFFELEMHIKGKQANKKNKAQHNIPISKTNIYRRVK